jgi:hypothetical protein
VTATSEGV